MEDLLQRAKVARDNPKFRLADFEPLIADLRAAAKQQVVFADESAADSIDFGLGQADRDEAAASADRAKRNAAALAAAADALTAKRAERQESDKAKAVEAERAAAIAERDELASKFAEVVPQAIEAMTGLFAQLLANEQRLKRAGLRESNAELKARGLKSAYANCAPIDLFTQMKIPAWAGKGRAWPPKKQSVDRDRAAVEAARASTARRAAELEDRWGRYRIEVGDVSAVIGGVSFLARVSADSHAEKVETIYEKPFYGQIAHTEAARLRKLGVTVEALDPAPSSADQEVAA